jgi:hypothetical protein
MTRRRFVQLLDFDSPAVARRHGPRTAVQEIDNGDSMSCRLGLVVAVLAVIMIADKGVDTGRRSDEFCSKSLLRDL